MPPKRPDPKVLALSESHLQRGREMFANSLIADKAVPAAGRHSAHERATRAQVRVRLAIASKTSPIPRSLTRPIPFCFRHVGARVPISYAPSQRFFGAGVKRNGSGCRRF